MIFFTGLILSFAALMGDQVDEMPLALWMFANSSYHEQQGIRAILGGKTLNAGDEGFDQITDFISGLLRSRNKNLPDFVISDLKLGDYGIALSGGDASVSFVVKLTGYVDPPQKGDCQMAMIKENAENRKLEYVLPWRFALFFTGALLETYGCFMEGREPEKEVREENYYYEENEDYP